MPPVFALIPARGGSKGIPKKNLVDVAGRPLIAYTIEAAKAVDRIEKIFVSSDDAEILSLAAKMGCEALLRPSVLANDQASAVDVVKHFISSALTDAPDDAVMLYLQPTSPFRTARHIEEALMLLEQSSSRSVVSVTPFEKSPYKAFKIAPDGTLLSLFDQSLSNANRQDLPATFIPNGALYGFTLGAFRTTGEFPSNGSLPYMMSAVDSIDVDNPRDLEAVRAAMEQKRA